MTHLKAHQRNEGDITHITELELTVKELRVLITTHEHRIHEDEEKLKDL